MKVVHDVIGDVLRNGFTLARSLELAAQWSCILSAGPLHPVTMEDLLSVQEGGSGCFHEAVGDLHGRLSDFTHGLLFIVEMRLFGVRGVGSGKTVWSGLVGGCGLIWFPHTPFCGVLALLLVDLVSWQTLHGLMKNSVKFGFPTFVALGEGKPAWRNLMRK